MKTFLRIYSLNWFFIVLPSKKKWWKRFGNVFFFSLFSWNITTGNIHDPIPTISVKLSSTHFHTLKFWVYPLDNLFVLGPISNSVHLVLDCALRRIIWYVGCNIRSWNKQESNCEMRKWFCISSFERVPSEYQARLLIWNSDKLFWMRYHASVRQTFLYENYA